MALTGEAMPAKAAGAGAAACRHALRLLLVAGAALAAYLLFGMFDRAAYADTLGTVLDPLSPVVSAVRDLPIIGTSPDAGPVTAPAAVAPPAALNAAGTPSGNGHTAARSGKAAERARPAVSGLATPLTRAVPAVLGSTRATATAPVSQLLPGLTSAVTKALGSVAKEELASAGDLVRHDVGGPRLPPVPALPLPGQLPPPVPPLGGPADPPRPVAMLLRAQDAAKAGVTPPAASPAQRSPGAPSFSQVPTSLRATVTVPAPRDPRAGAARRSLRDGGPQPSRTTHDAGSAGGQRSGGDNMPRAATIAVPWHPALLARGDRTHTRSACSGRLVHHGRLPG
jgi:hypothetical protein